MKEKRRDWLITLIAVPIIILSIVILYHGMQDEKERHYQDIADTTATKDTVGLY